MIELRGISVIYANGVQALHATDLSFREGEFAVLLGPSGAGKSSLLRTLNGLVTPTRGTVHVRGLGEVRSRSDWRRHRCQTGMVFQQHQLIGRLSALDNVLTGRLGHHGSLRSLLPLPHADQVIALECLDRVGLLDRALHRADTLSGGQQQRVGFARALAQRPQLIIADEPVASLDPVTAKNVLSLLHRICKQDGITAIVSLHQIDLGREFADRLIALSAGRVVFTGAPDELTPAIYRQVYERPPAPIETQADEAPVEANYFPTSRTFRDPSHAAK